VICRTFGTLPRYGCERQLACTVPGSVMSVMGRWARILVLAVVAGGAAMIGFQLVRPSKELPHRVHVPMLSELGRTGKAAYDSYCAECHGKNGSGTDKGPALIHRVYHPGHHGDAAFFLAARAGVRQHHWGFGDMPARPHLSDEQITAIVRFVREVQLANGIGRKPQDK
jgi:cytochrome c5